VSVDAAADFAALLAVGLLNILAAAEAALALDTSLLPFCVNAEPAADFAALLADGLRSVRQAALAAALLVRSFETFRSIVAPLHNGY
jgi:hypothetical protein